MPRAARRFDIYLPLAYNTGQPIPDSYFKAIEQRLSQRFGGVTAQRREFPMRGIWQGTTRLYLDDVVVWTALDFRRQGSSQFIAALKVEMLRQFKQEAILITEVAVRVH
jgi:hypothetical protein